MRIIVAAALGVLFAGCGSSSESPSAALVGNWLFVSADGQSGLGVTFNSDSTYVALTMALTSTTTANAQVENGTYTANGSTLTSVPTQWTCPGPDPVSSASYSFLSNGSLDVTTSTGQLALARNTAPPDAQFSIAYGCFQSDGSFVSAPLAPVSN